MSLGDSQRALWSLVTAPEGVAAALLENDRSNDGPSTDALDARVRSTRSLAAVDRLEVYANAYFHRIRGVLEDLFPRLHRALGPETFHDLATSYLLADPPCHPSLRHVGERLPGFLADHATAAPFRRETPWAADLARLETMRTDVFDAEDVDPLGRDALAARPADSFAALRLVLGPATRLGRFEHPVHLWLEDDVPSDARDATTSPSESRIVVWRSEEVVRTRLVESEELLALESTRSGIRFGELCEWAATRHGQDEAPARAAGWLAQWLGDGLLRS